MSGEFDTPDGTALVDDNKKATLPWLHVFSRWQQVILSARQSGPTANRPTTGLWIGRRYWDTDLAAPVWVQSVNPTVWATAGGGGGGTGTVTSVSVASVNGFAGTVATASTTPAITLKTTITGLLKGSGTAISAATSGTDYEAPGAVAAHVAAADPHPQYALDTDLAGYVPVTRTVNGHALSANVTVTAADVSLGSVTNDAQTKAAIVPNTAPAAGNLLVGNAGGTAYASVAMSGDATLASTGVLTSTGKRRLANVTLGSAGASLASGTITACRFLEIHIFLSGYAGADTASLQFNGAAGTAYRYRWLTCAAAATTFTAGLVAASTDRIKIAAVNTTNSRRVVAFISNDSTVTEKLVKFESQFGTGSAATQDTLDMGQGAWVSGAATQITSISLVSSSNMNAGTQMTIYGWN